MTHRTKLSYRINQCQPGHGSVTALLAIAASVFAIPAWSATLAVGPGKTHATPCAAIGKAAAGDTIEIAGGVTYSGDVCAITANNLTIRGVNGRPVIDAAGKQHGGKGTWVVYGNDLVVENVEMLGARVADQNGAAFRLGGTNFTLRGSYLHHNENGILADPNANSTIVVETTEFSANGLGTGYTHNVYIGEVKSLVFQFNYSHDANVGHNLKSRALLNVVNYNRFSSSGLGQPSYEIDLPNAGTSYVIGNIIQQPAQNQNPAMLAYGAENPYGRPQDLYVVNNTFLNEDSSRGTFIKVGGGVTTPVLMQNNIFAGTGTVIDQASAVDRSNVRTTSPAFANRAAYDLHPVAGTVPVNGGTAPGLSLSGVALTPTRQYVHPASSEVRPVSGLIDIGAYELAGSTPPVTTPTNPTTPTTPTTPTNPTTPTTPVTPTTPTTPVRTGTAPPRPPVSAIDVTAPAVAFVTPINGARLGSSVKIEVAASDNVAVSKIVLYYDGKVLQTTPGPTMRGTLSASRVSGKHVFRAVAFDTSGNQSSATVNVVFPD